MTLKIYGRKSSANVQKVLWFCHEAGLNFISENYGGKYGRLNKKSFKKLNPNSRVPVLKHNQFLLYESNSILRYLSKKFNFLNFNNVETEALINQWMDWGSFSFGAPCVVLTYNTISLPKPLRDEKKVLEAKKQLFPLLNILDTHLYNNEYIVGKEFTLADIPLGCWINRCIKLEICLNNYTNVYLWINKLKERDSFIKMVELAPLPPN